MKSLYDILTIFKSNLEINIPDLLNAAGLDDFAVYKIGGSRNAKEKGLFIYQDKMNYSYEQESISVMFQLQLFDVDEIEAAKYTDIIFEYLLGFEPEEIECDLLQTIDIDSWPLDQNSTTFIYINCEWSSELDSCD